MSIIRRRYTCHLYFKTKQYKRDASLIQIYPVMFQYQSGLTSKPSTSFYFLYILKLCKLTFVYALIIIICVCIIIYNVSIMQPKGIH